MTNEEAKQYFIDSNETIISVAKDENKYNYETQQIEDVFMRRDFEAKELAIKALEQQPSEDCISREETLKAMCDKCPMYNCVTGCSSYRHIEKMPPVTPQQSRWIPCSERLPERDTNVLTYHKNVSFEYVYVSWIDDFTGKWAGFIGNLPDDVLAWMPLPEPYEKSEE
ncbi:MAG: DUF551 domain-containing protein [Ruminococcus sp.]|nr:DUF551 domain-containing protein [Ruminococcus sp.]